MKRLRRLLRADEKHIFLYCKHFEDDVSPQAGVGRMCGLVHLMAVKPDNKNEGLILRNRLPDNPQNVDKHPQQGDYMFCSWGLLEPFLTFYFIWLFDLWRTMINWWRCASEGKWKTGVELPASDF